MSIIHEALKKVQSNFQRQRKDVPAETAAYDPAAPNKSADNGSQNPTFPSWVKPVGAVIFLIIALIFGYSQVSKHWFEIRRTFELPNIKLPTLPVPTAGSSAKPKPAVPLAQVVVTPSASSENNASASAPMVLNIQGIVSQSGATVALINDSIHEAGDVVNGIKIIAINRDSITILKDGKEEVVKVGR